MNDPTEPQRVLILGATGMLGHMLFGYFAARPGWEAHGTVRSATALRHLKIPGGKVVSGVDVESADALWALVAGIRPHLVVNCVGLVKQLAEADDALAAIPINALLPHRLSRICEFVGARFIHISTDCVFNGSRGMYVESDSPDAADLYGRSKLLGEVSAPHCVTLRTSIIGPELEGAHGLLGWFLAQQRQVRGYRRAIFSGLTTLELGRVIAEHVVPNAAISGVYHVSAEPISKYELLRLIAAEYGKKLDIEADDSVVIDRSLDSTRFRAAARYTPPAWREMLRALREHQTS